MLYSKPSIYIEIMQIYGYHALGVKFNFKPDPKIMNLLLCMIKWKQIKKK